MVNELRGSKNLGIIKAIHTGINPPLNTKIIWFDDNVGVKIHKRYNYQTSLWTPFTTNIGASAYQLAVTGGYAGDEASWIQSLHATSPFDKANFSYFPRGRDETQFGAIGEYSYDFSDANKGALGDVYGQVGQIGVHPTEQYGALGSSTYVFGYNLSAEGYGDTVFGTYNHSDISSQFSSITGRNNYNNSYNTFMSGSYNTVPYTYLGHKTVFGNGNVVNGSAGLTSGVALLNKSFGTTIIGQANLDYTNTEQGVNIAAAALFIIGNGDVDVSIGKWTALTRSNALELYKNGLMILPSVSNALISAGSGKSVITRDFLESAISAIPAVVAADGSETKINQGTNVTITGIGTTSSPYVISSVNANSMANGISTVVTGAGTTASPYKVETVNLQRTVTASFTLADTDNKSVIVINNGVTAVVITIPASLLSKISVGFIQQGTGEVSFLASGTTIAFPATLGLKIKGQNWNAFIMQVAAANGSATNNYQLFGNIKA